MTRAQRAAIFVVALIVAAAPAFAADATGTWTSSFDTPIGPMNYTYTFKVAGTTVTGTADAGMGGGPVELKNGRVEGNTISFVEDFEIMGMVITISYSGTMTSEDEIKFTRVVGEFATEEIVAVRKK
jgi:hypothetical protein